MNLPLLSIELVNFRFKVCWVVFFHFYSNFDGTSGDPEQTLHFAEYYLGLHCLSTSHKKTLGLYGLTMQVEFINHII